jgi:hypothetical protein
MVPSLAPLLMPYLPQVALGIAMPTSFSVPEAAGMRNF